MSDPYDYAPDPIGDALVKRGPKHKSDPILKSLVEHITETDQEMGIIVFMGSVGLKGKLIPAKRWSEGIGRSKKLPKELILPISIEIIEYLHLSEIKALDKKQRRYQQSSFLRVKLESITAWSVED